MPPTGGWGIRVKSQLTVVIRTFAALKTSNSGKFVGVPRPSGTLRIAASMLTCFCGSENTASTAPNRASQAGTPVPKTETTLGGHAFVEKERAKMFGES